MNKFSISHTKWKCQYHIVFIPKYRRKVLYGKLKADLRDIIIKLCKYKNVNIKEGAICKDHVHLCVELPPTISISNFMGYIKGRSAIMIFDRYPENRSKWDQKFWATGYFVTTVGDISEEAVKQYIEEQEDADKEADLIK